MSKIQYDTAGYFVNNNTRYVFLDGNICDTLEQCYSTLQQQLSIPDYFGNNLDALEEVLADLEWVLEEKIIILILNPVSFLNKDMEKKAAFLDLINCNDNNRISIRYLGSNDAPLNWE